jgi:transcriptional regulator with XRE-family HTH domain
MLSEARGSRGLNYQEAADLVGVGKSQWWSWEHGKYCPRKAHLKTIARKFKLDYAELVQAIGMERY